MNCPTCGYELRPGAKFCPSCGNQVPEAPSAAPQQNFRPQQNFQGYQPQQPNYGGQPIQPVSQVQPNDAAYPFGDNSGYSVPPAPPTAPPVRAAAAAAPSPKKSGGGAIKAVLAVLICAVVGLGGVLGYRYIKSRNEKNEEEEVKGITQVVDDKLEEVLDGRDYDAMDLEERKQVVEQVMQELIDEDYIEDYTYDPNTGFFEFDYGDGQKGGLMLIPLDELYKKYVYPNQGGDDDSKPDDSSEDDTSSYVDESSKDESSEDDSSEDDSYWWDESSEDDSYWWDDDSSEDDWSWADDSSEDDSSQPTYISTNMQGKVFYGLGFPDMEVQIDDNADHWTALSLNMDIDKEVTVRDFKNLAGLDYLSVEIHGSLIDGVPVICTEEKYTEENYEEYANDIYTGGIIPVRLADDYSGDWYYWITPQFFYDNYPNQELDGMTVYLGCCLAYSTPDLVESIKQAGADLVIGNTDSVYTQYNINMENSFVERMMQGATAQEALDYAKSIWGADDFDWIANECGVTRDVVIQEVLDKGPAETKIHCGADKKFN